MAILKITLASVTFASQPDLLILQGHRSPVVDVALHPEGAFAASMAADGETIVWNLADGSARTVAAERRTLSVGRYLHFVPQQFPLLLAGSIGHGLAIDPLTGSAVAEYGNKSRASQGSIVPLGAARVLMHIGGYEADVRDVPAATTLFKLPYNTDSYVKHRISSAQSLLLTNNLPGANHARNTTLKILDLPSGREKATLPVFPANLRDFDWLPSGQVVCVDEAGSVTLWDVTTQPRLVAKLALHGRSRGSAVSLAISHSGQQIAVDDGSKTHLVAVTATGFEPLRTLELVSPLSFSPNDKRLLGGSPTDNALQFVVVDSTSGVVITTAKRSETETWPLFSPDSSAYVIGYADGTIRFHSVGDAVESPLTKVAEIEFQVGPELRPSVQDHLFRQFVGTVTFSRDNRLLVLDGGRLERKLSFATLERDKKHLPVWSSTSDGRSRASVSPQSWAFRVDGTAIVEQGKSRVDRAGNVGGSSGQLNVTTGELKAVASPKRFYASLQLSPEGRYLAALVTEPTGRVASRHSCVLLDPRTGKLLRVLDDQVSSNVNCAFAFAPAGAQLAATLDGKLRVWDLKSGAELPLLNAVPADRFWLVGPGDVLVTYDRNTLRGVSLTTSAELFAWRPTDEQVGTVTALALSDDGELAITGTDRGHIAIRDGRTGAVLTQQKIAVKPIGGVALSADRSLLAAADEDRHLWVWKVGMLSRAWAGEPQLIKLDREPTAAASNRDDSPPRGGFAPKPAAPAYKIFTDRSAFEAALKNLQVIDFEDVQTPDTASDVVLIDARRYLDRGIEIHGTDGQFVGRQFSYPRNYRAVSGKNMYAPGPRAAENASAGAGGRQTTVTFSDGKSSASVAAFGAHFIDVNYPSLGESGLVALDSHGHEIVRKLDLSGSTGEALFVGVITFGDNGQPAPKIAKVQLQNGSGWPQVYNNEGVVLDDFLFTPPVAESR